MNFTQPTLLLDPDKCRKNMENMAARARKHQVRLRPHFKTHQSQEIGRWFREFGVNAITVSSLRMAAYFAADGWKDITVAFPFNVLEISGVQSLAKDIQLNLTVENPEAIAVLQQQLDHPVGLFIKADTGYHRTGLGPDQFGQIDGMIEKLVRTPHLQFRGFLAHSGHSYGARGVVEILEVHQKSLDVFRQFRERYGARFPNLELSFGDTPSCSIAEDFAGIDEIRPGNFVFYDLMQAQIGACNLSDIAVAMVCPVVAIHPNRQEAILYGGGVHFAKDVLQTDQGKCYGQVVSLSDGKWQIDERGGYLKKLSQEHGTLTGPKDWIESLKIGQLIGVLPVHSCMTADINKRYFTTDEKWIDMMPLW